MSGARTSRGVRGLPPRVGVVGVLLLGVLGFAACRAHVPVEWARPAETLSAFQPPVAGEYPQGARTGALVQVTTEGWIVRAEEVAAAFPELGLDLELVQEVEVRASGAWIVDGRVVLDGVELRFLDAYGMPLEVGVCTRVLLAFASTLAVRREDVDVEPPPGAWIARDRRQLVRVGPVAVGAWADR